jgi:penicillin amidase
MRRLVRALIALAVVLVVAALGFGLWARGQLRASLPLLDGTLRLAGLTAPVTVTRDALGIPTIAGASREDVAFATGFLHAQDRFFQMDLARRRAAGELSALVGGRAFEADFQIRPHRFRAVAERALAMMDSQWRGILEAYTKGVNGGLEQLGAAPFEYVLLRQRPVPWRTEDCVLVVLSMFITLQDPDGAYEATLATMHDVLPEAMAFFLAPIGTEWDSPIVGDAFSVPPIPGPDVYNLRERMSGERRYRIRPGPARGRIPILDMGSNLLPWELRSWELGRLRAEGASTFALRATADKSASLAGALAKAGVAELGVARGEAALGSNSWAVAGRLTAGGGALIANDMHLQVRVPNTWYRAVLEWPDPGDPSSPHRLIGITLPGVPALVAGSNTHVAWGFTNSQGDWSDFVLLDVDPNDENRYRTPEGWRAFDRYDEAIEIDGRPPYRVPVRWTIWGPVMEPDHRGRARALRWVAHDAERLAASVTGLESARSIEEAFTAVNGLGTPGQNFVVADRSGRIGWTIYGSMARRVGVDGRVPVSWADGSRGWSGWLPPAEYPRILDPANGRIWTANARVVDGEMLARIGDGNYEIGSRARIIRERLKAQDQFSHRDFLNIQLDTSAAFLSRWRDLILGTLTGDAIKNNDARARFRGIVERDWDGHASPGSGGYRLTRMFREETSNAVIAFVVIECIAADPLFDYKTVRRREGPIWKLVSEKPMHLLDPTYPNWDAFLLDVVDTVIQRAEREGGLAEPWSGWNRTAYRHPLSAGIPFVGRWLDMPERALAGDLYTPNMHWGANAPSERMIVSPGRESEGIMHMPTGQSGHPLSPFYRNSHEAWVTGEATPFLPGPVVHTLTLTP